MKNSDLSSLSGSIEILPQEILFVINPNSGSQNPSKIIDRIKRVDKDLDYIVTKDKKAVKALFDGLDPKYKAIVIVGGDGTINYALQYLVKHPDLIMAVLPNGSGNGFARDLGFNWDIAQLIKSFQKGDVLALDLLEINGELAINVSGLGIDSQVAYHFQNSKRRGLANYVLATAKAMVQFKDFEAKITTQQGNFAGKYRMITVANTSQFGNNAFIAPLARPFGGQYVLVIVKPFPMWKYPGFIIKMFRGKLKSSKYIEYLNLTDESIIRWNNDKYHLDGEPKATTEDLRIKLLAGRVKVLKRKDL